LLITITKVISTSLI